MDTGPRMSTRNPFAFELYQGIANLAEETGPRTSICDFEAPRDHAEMTYARDRFKELAGIGSSADTPLASAFHDMDEAYCSYGNAMLFHGIEIGLAFAAYRDALAAIFPERSCPACKGHGTTGVVAPFDAMPPGERAPVDCSVCHGEGYVAGRFGPAAKPPAPRVVDTAAD